MSIVDKARAIATEAHKGVSRKWGNDPYIVHPERVANKVANLADADDVDIAAALAHDVIEDADPSMKDHYAQRIKDECGADVLDLVMELTFPTEGAEWAGRPRAEKNVIRFAQMRKMSRKAQRIKMVDRWDNLNDMNNAPHRLIQKTVDESWTLLDICKEADAAMASELKDAIMKRAKGK
jgi:(p)ppGpp synthase/HD superfamily hydrolase